MLCVQNKSQATFCAVFGALALFAATLFSPSSAEAARVGWVQDFSIGTIDKAVAGKWDPAKGGTFQGGYVFRDGDFANFQGQVTGPGGTKKAIADSRERYEYGAKGNTFRNNYSFSLSRASSFELGLELSTYSLYWAPFEKPLTITLTNSASGFVWEGQVSSINWSNVWGNLGAGDYTLSVSGTYGTNFRWGGDFIWQYYKGNFKVGDAPPGDVPLPGALVLLGTALAGAGVYGRRKTARK